MADFYEPTITPYQAFNASEDAKILRKAMKGLGTDEGKIIGVLSQRSAMQRLDIAHAFKCEFGRDLIKDLKDELGGKFEKLILALMDPLPEYLAKELHHAMEKIGTDEDVLNEVLCTRGNQEILNIIMAYGNLYGKNLEEAVCSEVSGHYKRLLVQLLMGVRDESRVYPEQARSMAESLYSAGEGTIGTNEEAFTTLLAHQSFYQLKLVFDEYMNVSGKTFEQAVESEMSGELKEAIMTIVKCAMNKPAYFAEKLHKAMKGAGTEDSTLIRIIVSRSEIDLGAIKREYAHRYSKTVASAVKSETSGDYQNCLLAIIGMP